MPLASEAEPSRMQQMLANLSRLAHIGGWELDLTDLDHLNENPLRWTDETYRIFGYEPGAVEVTNELFFRAACAEDRPRVEGAVAAALRGHKTYEIEHRIVRPDGSERYVQEWAELVTGELGRPVRLIGTCQDVTERKRTEEVLRLTLDDRALLGAQHVAAQLHELHRGDDRR